MVAIGNVGKDGMFGFDHYLPHKNMIFKTILISFIFFNQIFLFHAQENPILRECQRELKQIYADWHEMQERYQIQRNKLTVACPLSRTLQNLPFSQLLNMCSELLDCIELPFETQSARAVYVGCLDPTEHGLTILSAHFGSTNSTQLLFLSRQHQPLWALQDLPKPEPKFRRFPTLDLRLPADFFYPFGCT